MRRTSEDHQKLSTIIFFVLNKNVTIKTAISPIINSNDCITPIVIRPNSVSFTPTTLIIATTKVFAHSPIHKTKSSKIFNFCIFYKKMPISTCTSLKPSGAPSLKSIFINKLVIKGTSVPTPITSKIFAEILRSINMSRRDANFGNFPMKLNP